MGHGSASCPGQAPHLVGPAASQRRIAVREKMPGCWWASEAYQKKSGIARELTLLKIKYTMKE